MLIALTHIVEDIKITGCLNPIITKRKTQIAIMLILFSINKDQKHVMLLRNEPRYEKTGLRGFLPGPTQTGLYNHRT